MAFGLSRFLVWDQIRDRGLDRWLLPYLGQVGRRRRPRPDDEVHLLLCLADHYEPKAYGASPEVARGRVEKWVDEYPRQFGPFRDSDGRPPRYSFFYPYEEYEAEFLDALAGLCRDGFGEVEIHLHHENDTADGLRDKLVTFRDLLWRRHGLLSRDKQSDALKYAFIHGNWALCNSYPGGLFCGVDDEISVLVETGCYADLTFPSAPDPTQPSVINSLYYAKDRGGRPRSHDRGWPVGWGTRPSDSLLLIEGPLLLDWKRRKYGLLPRLENGCLQASQPPAIDRLDNWLKARIQVPTRPDWYFVKLHAHGAPEESHEALLGGPMIRFHEELARRASEDRRFHFHYVTAREMYNLVKAAEDGWTGSVVDALDYRLVWNGGNPSSPHDVALSSCNEERL